MSKFHLTKTTPCFTKTHTHTHTHTQPVTYRLALLVLASVQHSPVDLSRVPLGQEGRLTFGVQELEHLHEDNKSSKWLVLNIFRHGLKSLLWFHKSITPIQKC